MNDPKVRRFVESLFCGSVSGVKVLGKSWMCLKAVLREEASGQGGKLSVW